MSSENNGGFSNEHDDAVCFTAGLHGASFGAGTIHAYLASDRTPPKVAAGVSVGALTAAVMERCYCELRESRTEAARWTWLRRYLSFLLHDPYDVVWDAIPNPSDFVADLPPVTDSNLPSDADGKPLPGWVARETMARRRRHMIARLGRWCSRLPIAFSSIAWIVVRYVRFKERYPRSRAARCWNALALWARVLWVEWRLLINIVLHPQFFPEWQFRAGGRMLSDFAMRPLFGWKLWIATVVLVSAAIFLWLWNLRFIIAELIHEKTTHALHLGLLGLFTCAPLIPLAIRRWVPLTTQWGFKKALVHLGIHQSLIDDFHLRLNLFRLFAEGGSPPRMKDLNFPVLLVAAPLQIPPQCDSPVQLWPSLHSELSIVDALRASLAVPRLFSPTMVTGAALDYWLKKSTGLNHIDLVDGSTVRHNPLPALFQFFHDDRNHEIADQLSKPASQIYLVYDIPIHAKPLPSAACEPGQEEPRLPNIVDTGFAGNRLERRRDSRLEVIRTNYISNIERAVRAATGSVTSPQIFPITVNEIAPDHELKLDNALQPTETEILMHIADGCRKTLSVLYREEITAFAKSRGEDKEPVPCSAFLHHIAPQRDWTIADYFGLPGLTEVCRHCTRVLQSSQKPIETLLPDSFRATKTGALARRFPELCGDRPRIVFLASGGVFRGSFHVGMIAALHATGLKPDIIVGASVGTLLGAVLGSMFSCSAGTARAKLRRLTTLFLEVDRRVALTATFKSATKDLGIRGRGASMDLSPDQLRKMVNRGSRKDPGLAITGAPPALIDAISDLFLIPYRATADIAAEFVAGHVTRATHSLWTQIKTETIDRLGIHDAIMGSALLERETRLILGDISDQVQPFYEGSRIAFFATAVNLVTEWINILGTQLVAERYDLIEALLASSAFPAAFAPRRASALYPGVGRRDVFFGDGGMFDNLPFLPALEILREVQIDRLRSTLGQGMWRKELARRYREPDLFLVGALNARQSDDRGESYASLKQILARANSLEDNEKIYGMERAARRVDQQLSQVCDDPDSRDAELCPESEELLNGIVNSAVMPIYPADVNHLNGTYQFCSAVGMNPARMRRSIADGCFQTMRELAIRREQGRSSLAGRSLAALIEAGRAPSIIMQKSPRNFGACPFFQLQGEGGSTRAIPCPFEGMHEIYRSCSEDPVHINCL